MILLARLLLLCVLLLGSLLGPGLLVVRRLRWKPKETLCASIALSLFFYYVAAFGVYALRLPNYCYGLVTFIAFIATFLTRRNIRGLLRNSQVRAQVRMYGVLLVPVLCAMGMIRHYSGGIWAGDWFEHYQRVRFFLDHHPTSERFLDIYSLAAQPPMMNVIVAALLAQIGDAGFALFQLAFVLLNLLVVVPCVLFLSMFGARQLTCAVATLMFLLAVNPMFMQNVTFTWTKLLCAFYVLLGIWLYLRGWQKQDGARTIGGFVCLAIGTLVHFSTGPFIVVLLVHYALAIVRRRPMRLGEPLIGLLLSAIILATWFGWSVGVLGWHETFASNTSVNVSAQNHSAIERIIGNCRDTLIPYQWRYPDAFTSNFSQANELSVVRDYAFCLYQHNVILGMGSLSGVVIAILVLLLLAGRALPRRIAAFWRWLVLGAGVLGVAVEGSRELLGVAHLCLQPLLLIGLVFLAARFGRLGRVLRMVIVVACLADFGLGIGLQLSIEHLDMAFGGTPASEHPDVVSQIAGLNHRSIGNWAVKHAHGLTFLGDHTPHLADLFLAIQLMVIASLIFLMLQCGASRVRIPAR